MDRLVKTLPEFRFSPWQAGDATLTAIPVSGRKIEQHLGQLVLLQFFGQQCCGSGIGKQVLDAGESCPVGGGKAFLEGHLIKKKGEVGGESWHGLTPAPTPCPDLCRAG